MTHSDLTPAELGGLLNLAEMEVLARQRMPTDALNYYASGANDELTLAANRGSYRALKLVPRVLVDVSHIDTRTTLLGLPLDMPIAVAPCALQGLVHPDGEVANARAAAQAGSVMTLSTLSNKTIEEVAQAAAGRLWFQLYLYKDREVSRALVQRAQAAGARALVLTVDAPLLGRREVIKRHPLHVPADIPLPNVGERRPGSEDMPTLDYFDSLLDPSLNWPALEWLKSVTDLPIVLKGIHAPDDATRAAKLGCHVWVSNHGGRQLDTAVTALEMLPEIRDAVAGQVEIYMDGGITRGTDVLKALALGARAVFLGRAPLYGLALAGEVGVAHTLSLLHEELKLAMALCGKTNLSELGSELIRS